MFSSCMMMDQLLKSWKKILQLPITGFFLVVYIIGKLSLRAQTHIVYFCRSLVFSENKLFSEEISDSWKYVRVCRLCQTLTVFCYVLVRVSIICKLPSSNLIREMIGFHFFYVDTKTLFNIVKHKGLQNTAPSIQINLPEHCLPLCLAVIKFDLPVASIFTPVANLFFFGWIVSTTGKFIPNIKVPLNILRDNSCCRLRPLLTALLGQRPWQMLNNLQ